MLQTLREFARQLTWRDGLFAVKSFAAGMAALYIAFRLNLSQPSWALTTVYVVSQPFAGMVLAKAFYRVLGTVIGAAMSLVLVALFANSPELFCLALALWIGIGTTITIYLRDAPQAYVGMLAGYSAAIIGLPAALAPAHAFDFAIARCLEIMLGILCGTLVHSVVFPRRAGDALRRAVAGALPSMASWATDALRGLGNEAQGLADRRKIISTVVAMDGLRVFAALDTPTLRAIGGTIRRFEGRLLSLLAVLVPLYDRLGILQRRRPYIAADLQPMVERVARHIAGSANAVTPEQSQRETAEEIALKAEIAARLPAVATLRDVPGAFLVHSILSRLQDVLAMWQEAVWLRAHIAAGVAPRDAGPAPSFRPYRDATFAAVGGLISAITVLVASAFWIASAWSNGPAAVTFAGIMCAIMGGRDDPASAATGFMKMSLVGVVLAATYLFVVLPPLTTFPALVVALVPLYLGCGLLLTFPGTVPYTMPVIFIGGGLIGLSNTMDYSFDSFVNNYLGYVVGMATGAAALTLLRPLGTEWIVQRLTRGIMRDLARLARSATPEPRSAFESRMFDRINALLMRLDPMNAMQRAAMRGALASLRVGLNILALESMLATLPPGAASSVRGVLDALADHFGRRVRPHVSGLLPTLEAARDRCLALGDDALLTRAAESLYSIEMTLRQHPGFFGSSAAIPAAAATGPVPA